MNGLVGRWARCWIETWNDVQQKHLYTMEGTWEIVHVTPEGKIWVLTGDGNIRVTSYGLIQVVPKPAPNPYREVL